MNVFGIGLPEMVVIAAIGLLVFGPKRLPELGKTLGRTLKGFQSASQEFEKELKAAVAAPAETATTAVQAAVAEPAALLAAVETSAVSAPQDVVAVPPEPPAAPLPVSVAATPVEIPVDSPVDPSHG